MRPTDSSTSSTPARSTASRMNNVPNGPASLEDTQLDALLVLAIHHRNVYMINVFIEAGASPEGGHDEDELTPLMSAIDTGNVDVIKALIEAGASLEATGAEVCTPIEYAIKCDGNVDVINVLKDAERARSEEACLKAIFSKEYAMPDVELDFEPSHEGHPDLPFPPKAWIS